MMSRIIPILCVVVALALFFGYINPTVTGTIATLNDEIKRHDSALQAAKRFEQKRAQLTIEQNALPPDAVARLESFLPDSVDNVQLILDLDALAARTGLQLGNFQTSESDNSASGAPNENEGMPINGAQAGNLHTDSLDLSLSATGSYASLRAFLTGVESSLRPLDLIEFNLADSANGVYTYQMTFRLYWLR